jgi:hypothetical protein
MHKDDIAEWILQLVTTRERATATVGPFWWSVLRTAAALLWQGIAEDPRGMLGLALRTLLMSWVFTIFWQLAALFYLTVAFILFHAAGGRLGAHHFDFQKSIPFLMAGYFLAGRWIAKRAPGREYCVCLVTVILFVGLDVPMILAFGTDPKPWLHLFSAAPLTASSVSLFLGAFSIRRRATLA